MTVSHESYTICYTIDSFLGKSLVSLGGSPVTYSIIFEKKIIMCVSSLVVFLVIKLRRVVQVLSHCHNHHHGRKRPNHRLPSRRPLDPIVDKPVSRSNSTCSCNKHTRSLRRLRSWRLKDRPSWGACSIADATRTIPPTPRKRP